MAAAAAIRKVDRKQIYKYIADSIKESNKSELEVSSTAIAEKFGVQAPTIDYHLNKLVEEGYIILLPKRGRYNRKIYRLASEPKEGKKTEVLTPESKEKFEQFLKSYVNKSNTIQEEFPLEKDTTKEEPNTKSEPIIEKPIVKERVEPKPLVQEEKKQEPIIEKELTLDDKIEEFLNQSNQVHDASLLLQHEDREILSVMNETIQQTTVYLKDLSEQLSTIQNKKLIQQLIDDRNRMHKQVERLEEEVKEARSQIDNTIEKYEIDPDRVRFMHQMLVDTVDNYVNLPNHAMALGRTEFRNKISKEITDLVKYVLKLEK